MVAREGKRRQHKEILIFQVKMNVIERYPDNTMLKGLYRNYYTDLHCDKKRDLVFK